MRTRTTTDRYPFGTKGFLQSSFYDVNGEYKCQSCDIPHGHVLVKWQAPCLVLHDSGTIGEDDIMVVYQINPGDNQWQTALIDFNEFTPDDSADFVAEVPRPLLGNDESF